MVEFIIDHNLVGVNSKYFVNKGRMILSSNYRQCKASLVSQFGNCETDEIPYPPYKVIIQSHCYHDIDAFQKIILDALEEADIIGNDKDVQRLEVTKFPTKRGADQSHLVRVESYHA